MRIEQFSPDFCRTVSPGRAGQVPDLQILEEDDFLCFVIAVEIFLWLLAMRSFCFWKFLLLEPGISGSDSIAPSEAVLRLVSWPEASIYIPFNRSGSINHGHVKVSRTQPAL